MMVGGGAASLYLPENALLNTFISCAGVAVVLSAFGAQAQGAWHGWTMGGAVAIAFAMFLMLQSFTTPPMVYKIGSIGGDIDKLSDLVILDDDPMYQYRDLDTKEIKFILTRNSFKKSNIRVRVAILDSSQARSEFTMVASAERIAKAHLGPLFGNNRNIDWNFDLGRRVITENGEVLFKEMRSLGDLISAMPRRGFDPSSVSFFSRALTVVAPAVFAQSFTSVVDPKVYELLRDRDTAVRRTARDNLAARGPDVIPDLIQRVNGSDGQIKTGITYALAEMARRASSEEGRRAISSKLMDKDFFLLVDLSQDPNEIVRIQAGEFLYLLGDKRAIPPSVGAAISTSDETTAADQVFIIRESGKGLSSDEKSKVLRSLSDPATIKNNLLKDQKAVGEILKW